jgi:hypothetical protein
VKPCILVEIGRCPCGYRFLYLPTSRQMQVSLKRPQLYHTTCQHITKTIVASYYYCSTSLKCCLNFLILRTLKYSTNNSINEYLNYCWRFEFADADGISSKTSALIERRTARCCLQNQELGQRYLYLQQCSSS